MCERKDSFQVDHVGFYGKQRHGLDLFGFVRAWRDLPVDIGDLSGFNLVTLEWTSLLLAASLMNEIISDIAFCSF